MPLEEVGAPIEAALSRTLAGRALAQAGQSDRAVAELQRAAAAFDACGALRYRDERGARAREARPPPPPAHAPGQDRRRPGIESLTERELQVARLVVDRKTNPEIAAELFLSQKTVETHLRNIFRKMDVAITRRPRTCGRARRPNLAHRTKCRETVTGPSRIRVQDQAARPMSAQARAGRLEPYHASLEQRS